VSGKYGVHDIILEVFKEILKKGQNILSKLEHKSQINFMKIQNRQNCMEQVKAVAIHRLSGP
jgi:hypothetical protein